MKTKLTKSQAEEKIKEFFDKKSFLAEEVKRIKRLSMKFNIKLKTNRKQFCKSCLSQLKGKTRISKTHKTVECEKCRYKNKFSISLFFHI